MSGLSVARLIALVAVVAVCATTCVAYRRDMTRARSRISSGSQVVETSCGLIEYAVAGGDGAAILIAHGAGGGYDQGLDLADTLIEERFRVIAVSRFGYLRAPLPADASAAAQADAFECLLDAIHIQRAVIIGVSAGGPSTIQFALRHPQRVVAMVLLVPAAYPAHIEQRGSAPVRWLSDLSLRSDFVFWLATRLARRSMMQVMLGTPPSVIDQASGEEQARAARFLDHLLPVTARRRGIFNDATVVSSLPRYDLERIHAPTLVISSNDDGYGTYEGARYSAAHIPGARFLGYASGGHLLIGHQQEVLAQIEALLGDMKKSDSVLTRWRTWVLDSQRWQLPS